ncbi:piggyBac transposable element-derived protein 4-like [Chelonus insularis]|uniref:piggyBac transposable element-derived protein 4-like n=1 Tax=Chelonus insularis TaxID=460826 RepID=UPI00158D55D9|nr:piggyBac transposable element-derived protein 4-like [Chelonus insularis]
MRPINNNSEQNLSWLEEEENDYFHMEFEDNEQFSDAESRHSEHDTDTEQSEESGEAGEDDQGVEDNNKDTSNNYTQDGKRLLLGKDKKTIWYHNPPNHRVRTKKHNLVIRVPGPKGVAKEAKTILECWELFFDNSMIEKIVNYTNIYLQKIASLYRGQRDSTPTNVIEIRALFGLLYFLGMRKAAHLNLKELWATDGTAPDLYRAVMSYGRFCTLLSSLKLDDMNDRDERKKIDNLAAVREFYEKFNTKCEENYVPGSCVTVEEMLESFRGRCKFRQYIRNKPTKYGIKIYSLVDSRTFYTVEMEIYAGKQPPGKYDVSNSAFDVVKRITAPILNTGRNVTFDNYFTSVPLLLDLLKNHRTTAVGTIRLNKREIPQDFLCVKNREICSSRFLFSDCSTLMSYVPKKSKNVLLISTLHNDAVIDKSTGDKKKPEILSFYNVTKGAVDTVDEMKSNYTVARETHRWPIVILYSFLNIAVINSHVIWKANTEVEKTTRDFIKELSSQLFQPHLQTRMQMSNLSLDLRRIISKVGGIPVVTHERTSDGLCGYCPRRKNIKTKKSCSQCSVCICLKHTIFYCLNCQPGNNNLH